MLDEVQRLGAEAVKLADTSVWALADDELTACLQAVHQLEQTVGVVQARLVRQISERGLPRAQGYRGTAGWLQAQMTVDAKPARDLVQQAEALGRRPVVEQAVLDGRLDMRQAAEIIDTVDHLPEGLAEFEDVGPAETAEIVVNAETAMLEMAGRLSALQLRLVGERILAYVAPGLAERAEATILARQEARAHRGRGFTMSAPRAGAVRLSGQLSVEDAAIVNAALQPLCRPAPDDDRSVAQRRADALVDVCRLALRTGDLPDSGGEPAQVTVTTSFDVLSKELTAGTTETGARVSAEVVRRMACDATIVPVVLGGAGQVLDVGRTHRLATAALRRALAVRDGGCCFPDCDRPPRWTDVHHIVGWSAGGATCLSNLVLLCRRHHRLIHHRSAGWQVRLGVDGLPEFIPPPHVDPGRNPRRNIYRRQP